MLVSHNKLEVCSSLAVLHERCAIMADLVKLRKKFLKKFSIKCGYCSLPFSRKHTPLSMHSTHTVKPVFNGHQRYRR